MTIEQILTDHRYYDDPGYCSCGTSCHPGCWTDWVTHVAPILDEYMDKPVSNMPPGMRLRIKHAQEEQ